MQPFPAEREMAAHLMKLQYQGFTIVPNAIPADLLKGVRDKFDELVENCDKVPTAVRDEKTGIVDLNRMYELDPVFEDLMDLPSVFPIAKEIMEGDVTLLGGSIGQYLPPHTPSNMAWHMDGDYVRFTYILDDLDEDGGGTGLFPGTHRSGERPPEWMNTPEKLPYKVPGMVRLAASAGSCMVNYTTLWHTRTPNKTDRPRRLIWQVYKRSHQPLTSNESLCLSQEYIERQTDPRRRVLVGLEGADSIGLRFSGEDRIV